MKRAGINANPIFFPSNTPSSILSISTYFENNDLLFEQEKEENQLEGMERDNHKGFNAVELNMVLMQIDVEVT